MIGTALKRELCCKGALSHKEGLWCEGELRTNSENILSTHSRTSPSPLEKLTKVDPGAKSWGPLI